LFLQFYKEIKIKELYIILLLLLIIMEIFLEPKSKVIYLELEILMNLLIIWKERAVIQFLWL